MVGVDFALLVFFQTEMLGRHACVADRFFPLLTKLESLVGKNKITKEYAHTFHVFINIKTTHQTQVQWQWEKQLLSLLSTSRVGKMKIIAVCTYLWCIGVGHMYSYLFFFLWTTVSQQNIKSSFFLGTNIENTPNSHYTTFYLKKIYVLIHAKWKKHGRKQEKGDFF